jgi:adenosine deaminase
MLRVVLEGEDLRMPVLSAQQFRKIFSFVPFLLLLSIGAFAQTRSHVSTQPAGERAAGRALDIARANPLALRAFLVAMPKGGDLHNHLAGAVYAESWIRAAVEDNLCIDSKQLSFSKPPPSATANQPCGDGKTPAASALKDQRLYDALIDAFSMRSFVPSSGVSGHDQFFTTFPRFGGSEPPQVGAFASHTGEWLDEVAARAAAQNEQYLELMHTPNFVHTSQIAAQIGWKYDLAELRKDLLDRGLRDDVGLARAALDQSEALRRQREHCGEKSPSPACRVQIRYLYQILRGFPREQVFAQTLLGFETASADPRFVGINFVMPEDGYTSMDDYTLHMGMVAFLHKLYPTIHISLHAGELAPGLVAPDGLRFHIRQAVEYAHAERIGHGIDVMYEDQPYDLLREMAALHVMVEINLTSEDVILGVAGKDHPFSIYRKFAVPVALSTDDEGVSRIDLTHEYVRAVETYGLHYADLKQMVRTSLEHSFLPGPSLWAGKDLFSRASLPCASAVLGGDKPAAACATFLQDSERAGQQWELERRFRAFESNR